MGWWGVAYCCQFTCADVSISSRPRDLDHLPLRFRFFWSPRPGSVSSARPTVLLSSPDSSILLTYYGGRKLTSVSPLSSKMRIATRPWRN